MSAAEAVQRLAQEVSDLEARIQVDDECVEHLNKLYGLIWVEACYDGDHPESIKFAQKCLPHIRALNKKLKFKT